MLLFPQPPEPSRTPQEQRIATLLESDDVYCVEEPPALVGENGHGKKPRYYFYTQNPDKLEDAEELSLLPRNHPVQMRHINRGRWYKIPLVTDTVSDLIDREKLISGDRIWDEPYWHQFPDQPKTFRWIAEVDGAPYLIMGKLGGESTNFPIQFKQDGIYGKVRVSHSNGAAYGIVAIPRRVADAFRRGGMDDLEPQINIAGLFDYLDEANPALVPQRETHAVLAQPTKAGHHSAITTENDEEELSEWEQGIKLLEAAKTKQGKVAITPFSQQRADGSCQYGVEIDHHRALELLSAAYLADNAEQEPETVKRNYTQLNFTTKIQRDGFLARLQESGLEINDDQERAWTLPASFYNRIKKVAVAVAGGETVCYLVPTSPTYDLRSTLGKLPEVDSHGNETFIKLDSEKNVACYRLILPTPIMEPIVSTLGNKIKSRHFHDWRDETFEGLDTVDSKIKEEFNLLLPAPSSPTKLSTPKVVANSRVVEAKTPKPLALDVDSPVVEEVKKASSDSVLLVKTYKREKEEQFEHWLVLPHTHPAAIDAETKIRKTILESRSQGERFRVIPVTQAAYEALEAHFHDAEGVSQLFRLDSKREDGAIPHKDFKVTIAKALDARDAENQVKTPLDELFIRHLSGKSLIQASLKFPSEDEYEKLIADTADETLPDVWTEHIDFASTKVRAAHQGAVGFLGPIQPKLHGLDHATARHIQGVQKSWSQVVTNHARAHATLKEELGWVKANVDQDQCAPVLMVIAPNKETIGFISSKDAEVEHSEDFQKIQQWFCRTPVVLPNAAGEGKDVLVLFPNQEGLKHLSPAIHSEEIVWDSIPSGELDDFLKKRLRTKERHEPQQREAGREVDSRAQREDANRRRALGEIRQRLNVNKPFLTIERTIQEDSTLGAKQEVLQPALVFKVYTDKEAARVKDVATILTDYMQGKAIRTRPRISRHLGEYITLQQEKEEWENNAQKFSFIEELKYHLERLNLKQDPNEWLNPDNHNSQRIFNERCFAAVDEYNIEAQINGYPMLPSLRRMHEKIVQLENPTEEEVASVKTDFKAFIAQIGMAYSAIHTFPKNELIANLESAHPHLKSHYFKHVEDLENMGDEEAFAYEDAAIYNAADSKPMTEADWKSEKPLIVKMYLTEPMADLMRRELTNSEILNPQVDLVRRTSQGVYEAARGQFGIRDAKGQRR